MKKIILLVLFLFSVQSQAFVADLSLNSQQDTFSTSSDFKGSRLFGALGLLADTSKSDNGHIFLGWYFINATAKNDLSPTITESITSNDMGPAIRWSIDSKRVFSLTFVYGVISKGKYENGATSEDVSGTSYLLKFSVEPEFGEHWNLGFALNYYLANYNISVVNSAETSVSYKNGWTFPSISVNYHY